MAEKFVKQVLRPGVYFPAGRQIVVTEQDCRDYFDSVRALADVDLDLPLMYEHTDPSKESGEGLPGKYFPDGKPVVVDYKHDRAEGLRRTVGKVDPRDPRNRIAEDGSVELVFEVYDPLAAAQLSDKRIKYVSPEMRPFWQDGLDRPYKKLFTHFALTHRPIQVDQKPGFAQLSDPELIIGVDDGVMQFSLADFQGSKMKLKKGYIARFLAQFADDDESDDEKKPKVPAAEGESEGGESDGGESKASVSDAVKEAADSKLGMDAGEENPDMPKSEDAGVDKKFEALLAHLAKAGIPLQSDTNNENLADRLLTALLTYNAIMDKQSAEESAEGESGGGDKKEVVATEQSGPLSQMSDGGGASVLAGRNRLARRINRLVKDGSLLPGVAARLLPKVQHVQFSDDGSPRGELGLLLDAFEGIDVVSPILDSKTGGYQMSDGVDVQEEQHPRGDAFYRGNELSDADGKKVAEKMLERNGYAKR